MHRTIEITTANADTEPLLRELETLREVTGLSVARGASIKPKGDVIIPAAAMIGASIAAGQSKLIVEAFERLGLDVLMILVAGVIVFFIKQLLVHRREPIV